LPEIWVKWLNEVAIKGTGKVGKYANFRSANLRTFGYLDFPAEGSYELPIIRSPKK